MTDTTRQNQMHNEVSQLFIDTDLKIWEEQTQLIEKESALFINLLSARLVELSKSRNISFVPLFDEIAFFTNAIPEFQEKFTNYRLKLEILKECDDLQCESLFLNRHQQIKRDVEIHLTRYYMLKKKIHDALEQF